MKKKELLKQEASIWLTVFLLALFLFNVTLIGSCALKIKHKVKTIKIN